VFVRGRARTPGGDAVAREPHEVGLAVGLVKDHELAVEDQAAAAAERGGESLQFGTAR
jgi:hypothetical protein